MCPVPASPGNAEATCAVCCWMLKVRCQQVQLLLLPCRILPAVAHQHVQLLLAPDAVFYLQGASTIQVTNTTANCFVCCLALTTHRLCRALFVSKNSDAIRYKSLLLSSAVQQLDRQEVSFKRIDQQHWAEVRHLCPSG